MANKGRLEQEKYWLKTIIDEGQDRLNSYEEEFISDMEAKLNGDFTHLTERQHSYLEKIYEKVTK